MILYEGYVHTVERTTTTKLIVQCHNRDCKAKIALIIDQLTQIKTIDQ